VVICLEQGANYLNHSDQGYFMKTTSGLVQFCGSDATLRQFTACTSANAALLPKHVSQQHRGSKQ